MCVCVCVTVFHFSTFFLIMLLIKPVNLLCILSTQAKFQQNPIIFDPPPTVIFFSILLKKPFFQNVARNLILCLKCSSFKSRIGM